MEFKINGKTINKKVGDELKFTVEMDAEFNQKFPSEYEEQFIKSGHLTALWLKRFVTEYFETWDYIYTMNEWNIKKPVRFKIVSELMRLATPQRPFFVYTPDMICENRLGATVLIEFKNNSGFIGKAFKTPPAFWNMKKKLIIGWCMMNGYEFLELRWEKKKWYDCTTSYAPRVTVGKKDTPEVTIQEFYNEYKPIDA